MNKLPVVPSEVSHLLDDRILEIHEAHASRDYEQLLKDTQNLAESTACRYFSSREALGAVVIAGEDADPEAGIAIYAHSYQQSWKPSKAAFAMFYHDVVNPEGISIFLPNNSGSSKYYSFSDAELSVMFDGDMRPMYERQMETVEKIVGTHAVGDVRIDGFSEGAVVGLGMAAVGSDVLSVKQVHSIEGPSEERTPKQLKSDFTKSSGPIDQVRAIRESAIPAYSDSLRLDRLVRDYVRFGLDLFRDENKAQMHAMATPGISKLVDDVFRNNDDPSVMLGFFEGSKMKGSFEPDVRDGLSLVDFSKGNGVHGHATGDNIVANVLLMSL